MDRDWKTFWTTYPHKANDTQYLRQVGKTVGGVQISQEQFDAILGDIDKHLDISPDDVVLDLCCGNGLITREIAKKCKEVVGIDFSEVLIETATEITQEPNVKYIVMDVRKIRNLIKEYESYFTKVLWYEALAFFDEHDLCEVLDSIKLLSREEPIILIGSVLDHSRKWSFFNTFKRKMTYVFKIVLLGQEVGLGKWWKREQIEKVCDKSGFACEFHYQNNVLHTAHYRIDVKITARG